MEPLATATEAQDYHGDNTQNRCIYEKENTETPKVEYYTLEPTAEKKERHTEKIIPVLAGELCMYHCVHAARDINWMKYRNTSGTSLDKYKEKEDAAKAQALRRACVAFLTDEGKVEAAQRPAIPESEGYPSTDEMLYLAEMLQVRIELVDLDMPACPMTTYG